MWSQDEIIIPTICIETAQTPKSDSFLKTLYHLESKIIVRIFAKIEDMVWAEKR